MRIERNISLKERTNLKVGGKAKFFSQARSVDEIREALLWARDKFLPLFVLGGGTNIVLPDEGWPGLVLTIQNQGIERRGNLLEVAAGVDMEGLLEAMLAFRLSGLEWAGGLPGTLGGAVRGNAGAFGGEIKDSLMSTLAMDSQGRIRKFNNKECQFTYRGSIFKQKPFIIISATLKFSPCREPKRSRAAIEEKLEFRRKKFPLEFPNVGSIFKNICRKEDVRHLIKLFPSLKERVEKDWGGKVPAAFLIERAGIKGMGLGGAKISEQHANFIINYRKASSSDFVTLLEMARCIIKRLYGVSLEPEVEIVRAPQKEIG